MASSVTLKSAVGAISSEQVAGDKQASGKAGNRWLGSEQESGSVITPMH